MQGWLPLACLCLSILAYRPTCLIWSVIACRAASEGSMLCVLFLWACLVEFAPHGHRMRQTVSAVCFAAVCHFAACRAYSSGCAALFWMIQLALSITSGVCHRVLLFSRHSK